MEQIGIKKMQGSIVEMLKDEILSGHIPCGTEMTQNELAASLGVSRMPVREALIILEFQGLIERLPNNHVRVAEFSEDYFQKIFYLCARLEVEVLEEMKNMQELEGEREAPVAALAVSEMEFHRTIYRLAPHSYIRKNLQTMTEIYIGFALQCREYDKEKGLELLRRAVFRMNGENSGEDTQSHGGAEKTGDEPLLLFTRYFDALAEAIMRERMR